MRGKADRTGVGICSLLLALVLSSAWADEHYVDVNSTNPVPPYTNSMNAANNIQDAVDAADAGDVVVVGPGVYASGERATPGAALMNRVAATNAIIIQSHLGAAQTMIVGAGPTGDSGVRCVYVGGGATLSGFTLTNGHTRAWGDSFKDCSGGGAYASGGTVANCVISGNAAATNGGGVFRGTVMNCVISGNSAGSGGGVAGGAANNCLIAANTAARLGGGAYVATLNNCTVCGNTAASGGGTYESDANNSIVCDNAAGTDTNYYAGSFSHSCVVPDPGGTGNTEGPPQFADYPTDLHLAEGSPCIDAGDNAYAVGGQDLDGNSRIMNGAVDMGAYEFLFVNVGGRVTLDYLGLEGVTVSDGTRSALTDVAGNYVLSGVPQGVYVLTASLDGYRFQPSSLLVVVTNDVGGQDFTAERFHVAAAINCGGASYAGANGAIYAADEHFSGGTMVSTVSPVTGTDDSLLYQDARQNASYSIPLTNGNYLLTFQFAEIQYTASGQRVFDVLADGVAIATNLDVFVAAGGHARAYDLTSAVGVSNGTLEVGFNAHAGAPLVNAILVVVDETGLVAGPMGTPTWWLREHGLAHDPIEVAEMSDTDGDGMAAWEEYVAGTDPGIEASRFCVDGFSESVSGRLQIAVLTVPGQRYRLAATTNLLADAWGVCPYATTPDGDLQSGVITADVDRTELYVASSNTVGLYRARIDARPFDAVAYGGHFYKVFLADRSWHEMKARCEVMGGYLACVESADEQAFITTLAQGRRLALGGTDEGGAWGWVNGSPWAYTSWAGGQPNGAFGLEHYLELYQYPGGLWNDVADRTADYLLYLPPGFLINWMPVGYVCEWER